MFNQFWADPRLEPSMDPAERASRNRNLLLLVGVILLVLGLVAAAWASGAFWLNAMLCSLAFFVASMLIGFLFGFPKSVSQGDKAENRAPGNAVAEASDTPFLYVNTNLEQISDWLTKIIVGVGLVELTQASSSIKALSSYLAPLFGGSAFAAPLASQVFVYFSSLGFLSGYITTRVFLSRVISDADRSILSVSKKQQLRDQTDPATVGPSRSAGDDASKVKPSIKVANIAKDISSTPLIKLSTVDDISAWAQAQLALGHWTQAAEGYGRALALSPTDITLHLGYGVALYHLDHQPIERAIGELQAAKALITPETDTKMVEAIYENLGAAYLYVDPPEGFQIALTHLQKALECPGDLRAELYYYLAAAYGQQYRWRKEHSAPAKLIKESHDAVITSARKAVGIDSGKKEWLWELAINPKSQDNDLVPFRDDPEFLSIVDKERSSRRSHRPTKRRSAAA